MIEIAALSIRYNCPSSGCPPENAALYTLGFLFPSGLTLAIAAVMVLAMRRIEINREDQGSQ